MLSNVSTQLSDAIIWIYKYQLCATLRFVIDLYSCLMFAPLFQYLSQFRTIPQADIDLIQPELSYLTVAEDEYLLKEGNVSNKLYFICRGILRIATQNEQGNVVTHFFLKENQLVTILDSFQRNTPSKESILAACETEVIVLSKSSLLFLYEKVNYLKELIDTITQQRLMEKIPIRNAYLGHDATTRYQLFLQHQPDIAQRVSLRDIASYLGITQQSLSRIRKNSR
jgi:CRP-like cAMP-binding protein